MANAAFGYENRLLDTWLYAGSEAPGLTVGNLQDQQTSDASSWRTNGSVVDAYFVAGAASSVTWRAFGLFRTNLTSAATIRWRVSDATGNVDNPVYDSDVIPAGVVPGIGQTVHVAPSDKIGPTIACDIDDPGNPDGFISVGGAFAGPIWRPKVNISPESAIAHNRARSVVTARSGAQYVTPLYMQRGWSIAHDGLADSDLWSQLWPLDQAANLGTNILFIPDSASAKIASETVFGMLEITSNITFQTPRGEFRGWRAKIMERL